MVKLDTYNSRLASIKKVFGNNGVYENVVSALKDAGTPLTKSGRVSVAKMKKLSKAEYSNIIKELEYWAQKPSSILEEIEESMQERVNKNSKNRFLGSGGSKKDYVPVETKFSKAELIREANAKARIENNNFKDVLKELYKYTGKEVESIVPYIGGTVEQTEEYQKLRAEIKAYEAKYISHQTVKRGSTPSGDRRELWSYEETVSRMDALEKQLSIWDSELKRIRGM